MAFVVLLIVSMGTLGRIETSRSYTQRQTALARQQALYALGLALGQLQDSAGPDRRVTANASILGGEVAQPHWAGVWDFTGSTPQVTWLVTTDPGGAGLPSPSATGGETVRMVGARTIPAERDAATGTVNWVEVPALALSGIDAAGDAVRTGRIAWWTGDEGVKASIQALDTVDRLGLDLAAAQALRQRANPGVRWREWFGPAQAEDWLDLVSLAQARQRLGGVSAAEERQLEALRNRYHDVTLNARGLLTNPLDGGLKINLGPTVAPVVSSRFDDVFGDGTVLGVWRDYPQPDAAGRVQTRALDLADYDALRPGDPYVRVEPVLAECAIFLSVFHHQSERGPALRFYFDVEFWNPYTRPLALVRRGEPNPFSINVTGLPSLTIENETTGQVAGPFLVDQTRRYVGGIYNGSWMQFGRPTGRESAEEDVSLQPGEVYRLQDPDPFGQARGLIKYSGQVLAAVEGNHVHLSGEPPPQSAGAEFILVDGNDCGGPEVFRLGPVPYDAFQYHFSPPLDGTFPPYIINSSDVNVADMYIMAFHYRIGSERSWDATGDWLQEFDLRTPRIGFSDTWIDGAGRSRRIDEFVAVASRNPTLVSTNLSDLFPGNQALSDDVPRGSRWGEYGDVRLYDLPVGEPVTIADFRLLPFKDLPPSSLGSAYPSAETLNLAFDRYFLSTVEPGFAPGWSGRLGADVLPNTRLQLERVDEAAPPVGALAEADAAESFTLRGAFNWNSTSVVAWQLALRQAFTADEGGWRARDALGVEIEQGELPATVFRHPVGAGARGLPLTDEAFKATGVRSETRRGAAFRQGVRLLPEPSDPFAIEVTNTADDPLRALAEAIVDALQARGRPFPSLSALLNDGLLQRAIEASGINDGFPPYANGHIRQSDLVGLLSLAPAVRSDTFVIRAMGEVTNPATGESEGQAWLEATVQRTIEFVDKTRAPNAVPEPVDAGPAEARTFKVVAFRWLDPLDDI